MHARACIPGAPLGSANAIFGQSTPTWCLRQTPPKPENCSITQGSKRHYFITQHIFISKTRMHSSRMRTGRSLTVSGEGLAKIWRPPEKLETPQKIGEPMKNWRPSRKIGDPPGPDHPPPWTELQTHVKTLPWPNFVAAGIETRYKLYHNGILRHPLLLAGQDTLLKFVICPERILCVLTCRKARCSNSTIHQCRSCRVCRVRCSEQGTCTFYFQLPNIAQVLLRLERSPSACHQSKISSLSHPTQQPDGTTLKGLVNC